ncbi:MAG: S9 family peptidase [Bacteroidetes bacterium]|nr:S9 family peptidase [Bacteroidota bacterium]
MKNLLFVLLLIGIMSCNKQNKKLNYPMAKKVDTVDTYFGTKVADPYRWLEDDNSKETGDWVKAENKVTNDYLAQIPYRDVINKRLKELWNYPKLSTPFKKGDKYFYFKNDGLQNQSVLYIQDDLDSEANVLLDPNILSDDGTVALSGLDFSKDGKYLAYSIARSGSDWNEIFVRDIKTGKDLKDHLKWVKFSGISFFKNGFYYSRYDETKEGSELTKSNLFQKVYYHKIGDDQSKDKLIYEDKKHPKRMFGASVSENEKFLFLYESEAGDGNSLYYKDLTKYNSKFIKLADGFDYEYGVIDDIDNKLLVKTNFEAPRYKLICIDLKTKKIKDFIPENENVLRSCSLVGGKIVLSYMKDAHSKVEVYNTDGVFDYEFKLPGLGTTGGISGKKDENIGFYVFTSFTTPSVVYKYDFTTKKSEIYSKPVVNFNPDDFVTEQVFFESKDGTKVPMFIFHKKGIKLDSNNPTIVYGYGGFNISLTPYFSPRRIFWIENGGVFAVVNLRGGGEYGKDWHEQGTKLNKQNVFDDCIAATEYLIEKKYTSPEKLALKGGSNGGLLVGAVINQRPDLYKAVIPEVGVMDMLRYHKFTIGWAWASDYGTSDDSVQFNNLIKYSPLHNIKENVEYPAVMVTTADHDDRVVPAHSFKYMATLQEKYKGNNPVLIRIETKAGHGGGMPTSKQIDEYTDIWSFLFYNLGMKPE